MEPERYKKTHRIRNTDYLNLKIREANYTEDDIYARANEIEREK